MLSRSTPLRIVCLGLMVGATLGAQSSVVTPLVDKEHRRMQPEAATDFSRGSRCAAEFSAVRQRCERRTDS